jgi:hypothetical protein
VGAIAEELRPTVSKDGQNEFTPKTDTDLALARHGDDRRA